MYEYKDTEFKELGVFVLVLLQGFRTHVHVKVHLKFIVKAT